MAITKNIGKNTLGDNNKMSVRLHEYEMSTHDLSFVWRNTQSPGTLVPFLSIPAQKGDVWDIKLFNKTLTHPTIGPMLGSYKLQHFIFTCPIRLYNSWLHNNRLGIGLRMSDVKLPKLQMRCYNNNVDSQKEEGLVSNPSSLAAYLGYRGRRTNSETPLAATVQALPYLMYWDIFKNYFANKQEKYAYYVDKAGTKQEIYIVNGRTTKPQAYEIDKEINRLIFKASTEFSAKTIYQQTAESWGLFWESVNLEIKTDVGIKNVTISQLGKNETLSGGVVKIDGSKWNTIFGASLTQVTIAKMTIENEEAINNVFGKVGMASFPLENIDKMRDIILQTPGNNNLYVGNSLLPYSGFNKINTVNNQAISSRSQPQYQLALKTYDSDLYQNWIQTEWIEGENGINEITAIDVSDGKLNLDTLNLAQKVYNMLNRIAVSGGTYRDWLETTYTAGRYLERPETPVFEGGMTQYIEFEEVVSQAATSDEPLGTLAGRGRNTQQKGSGILHIKIQEPSYIMGICAITPMIDYSQGNSWDVWNIKTMDDWHKPALDGIGYEDSINNMRAYWSGEQLTENTGKDTSIGKTVAWINYMTNVNKTFGNFASGESESFMCLNRNYEKNHAGTEIADLTTYIDPSKHNEIFADTDINAMNFWLQTACDIKVRRNISAKQIPNL